MKIAKNTVFVEGGGSGIGISINYDRNYFQKGDTRYSIRTGIMIYPYGSSLVLPFEHSFFWGDNHSIEVCIGVTYIHGFVVKGNPCGYAGTNFDFTNAFFATQRVGYRYQKRKGGLFFRLGGGVLEKTIQFYKYMSTCSVDYPEGIFMDNIQPIFGLDLGYSF